MSTQLQNKFSNFHPPPSEGIWNKIANALDADTDYSFAEKMLHYQPAPPIEIWDNIATELEKGQVDVVPLPNKYSHVFKYAAAIILFAGLIVTGILINNKSVSNEQAGGTRPTKSATPELKSTTTAGEKQISIEMQQGSQDLVSTNKIRRRSSAIPLNSLKINPASFAFKDRAATIKVDNNKRLVRHELLDRYIIFSKTTGDAVKLSKKLFSLFACSDTEDNCKKNIEAVQQKMASPTMMASADFTGVLEALQTINNQ